MKCVDCQRECRNHCSGCNRPYCATCRDASGYKTCLTYCRTSKAKQQQQSKVAPQHSQQVQQQTPVYVPPSHLAAYAPPIATIGGHSVQNKRVPRKPLYLMPTGEFEPWRQCTIDALLDAKARTKAYLARRRTRGVKTSTDLAMERDLILYDDLLEALQELLVLHGMADVDERVGQQQGSHSGLTGSMLTMYDDPDHMKLQP